MASSTTTGIYDWNPDGKLIEVYKAEDKTPLLTRAFALAGIPSPSGALGGRV